MEAEETTKIEESIPERPRGPVSSEEHAKKNLMAPRTKGRINQVYKISQERERKPVFLCDTRDHTSNQLQASGTPLQRIRFYVAKLLQLWSRQAASSKKILCFVWLSTNNMVFIFPKIFWSSWSSVFKGCPWKAFLIF